MITDWLDGAQKGQSLDYIIVEWSLKIQQDKEKIKMMMMIFFAMIYIHKQNVLEYTTIFFLTDDVAHKLRLLIFGLFDPHSQPV